MTVNSRNKGKRGELELAAFLREHGFPDARRGQQFRGGADSPDVVGLPGIHIEVKRVESGQLYTWLDQSIWDAGKGEIPVVAHRRNDREWVAILLLQDFLKLVGK
jgi:Holliday junction resolvase